jgi:hypothetical protein
MVLALAAPMVAACGGGGGSDGTPPPVVVRLCPASLDYSTVFTGGAGSGEVVKLQLDTTKMTWQLTYVQSPVPVTTGTVTPTRSDASLTQPLDSGTLTPETLLPTEKLNQCAFRLNGASLAPNNPARVFVGEGIAGGTIPGKEISFGGVAGKGAVPDEIFPFYPFVSFSSLETNIANVAGAYNRIGIDLVPSQLFGAHAVDSTFAIAGDGSFVECNKYGQNAGQCKATGTALKLATDGSGIFETDNFQGQAVPTLAPLGAQGKGFMIVGKVANRLVPVLVRTGVAQPLVPLADDESGISMLAPATNIAQGSVNGEYIGVDANFAYRTTALVGTQATLLDPFNASQAALAVALNLDYSQSVPGVITSTMTSAAAGSAPTGKFIFSGAGGVFGYLDTANALNPKSPYFTIGAFVQ